MADIAELVDATCQRFVERQLGVKMTKRQFRAYCRKVAEQEQQDQIDAAVSLLESHGYTVTPPAGYGDG